MSRHLKRAFLAATAAGVLVATLAPIGAAAAPGSGSNALQRRADRADSDRWNRSESESSSESEDDEEDSEDEDGGGGEDEEDEEDEGREDTRSRFGPNSIHRGELNGKLRLGEW